MSEVATIFSGGGLADAGFIAAGLKPIWAIEKEAKIASIYNANIGNHCLISGAEDVDFGGLRVPFWLHASPPCTRASVANTDATETEEDIKLAQSTIRSIQMRSPYFSLENVWGYRNFEAFRLIEQALSEEGYNFAYWHLNAADYGVPQTRKRLILVASRVARVVKPLPTHHKPDEQLGLFTQPWRGWYEAIADLIPTLPDSEFAPWQLERLPHELLSTCFVEVQNTIRQSTVRQAGEPSPCVTSSWLRRPASTPRAFVVDGKNIHPGDRLTVRQQDEPHFSVGTSIMDRPSHAPKAFIVPGGNASSFYARLDNEPAGTVGDVNRPGNKPRAFLIGDQRGNGGEGVSLRWQEDPRYTVEASKSGGKAGRAWLSHGRVVAMTTEALGRFQTLPQWYRLSGNNKLDAHIIGNGVPCDLMTAVVEAQQMRRVAA